MTPATASPTSRRRTRRVRYGLLLAAAVGIGGAVYAFTRSKPWTPDGMAVDTKPGEQFAGKAFLPVVSPATSGEHPVGSVVLFDLGSGSVSILKEVATEGVRAAGGDRFAVSNLDRSVTVYDGDRVHVIPDLKGTPVWSPDGRQLVISVSDFDGKRSRSAVWLMDRDGTNRKQLPLPDTDAVADWSAHDQQLVVTCDIKRDGTTSQIALVQADGSGRKVLVPTGINFAPRVSANGRQVLFFRSDPSGAVRLLTVPVAGGGVAEVVRLPVVRDAGGPSAAWLPDSRRILLSNATTLEIIDTTTGQRTPVKLPPVRAIASVDCK